MVLVSSYFSDPVSWFLTLLVRVESEYMDDILSYIRSGGRCILLIFVHMGTRCSNFMVVNFLSKPLVGFYTYNLGLFLLFDKIFWTCGCFRSCNCFKVIAGSSWRHIWTKLLGFGLGLITCRQWHSIAWKYFSESSWKEAYIKGIVFFGLLLERMKFYMVLFFLEILVHLKLLLCAFRKGMKLRTF